MAAFVNNVKATFLRGLEAVGKGASNMAASAHHRLSEINLESRRHEILTELPLRALDLWQNGAVMPEPLNEMLAELNDVDQQLAVMRAKRYARVETDASQDEAAAETTDFSEAMAEDADEAFDATAEPSAWEPPLCEDEPADAEACDAACACEASEDLPKQDAHEAPAEEPAGSEQP